MSYCNSKKIKILTVRNFLTILKIYNNILYTNEYIVKHFNNFKSILIYADVTLINILCKDNKNATTKNLTNNICSNN